MAASQDDNVVTFKGEFSTPLLNVEALKEGASALIDGRLQITNHDRRSLRFSSHHSVFPELLTSGGAVVPFDYGANRSRPARASDYALLLPGQSLAVSLVGAIELAAGKINWRGSDGILGYWPVERSEAPYRFRLKYRQSEAEVGPFADQPGVISGLWTGEAVTEPVELPIHFGS